MRPQQKPFIVEIKRSRRRRSGASLIENPAYRAVAVQQPKLPRHDRKTGRLEERS